MTDMIHIVILRLNLSDDYNKHAGALLVSVLERCSKPVTFHVIHNGNLSAKNKEIVKTNIDKYTDLVTYYNGVIKFHDVGNFKWHKELPETIRSIWNSVMLSRLHLHEILPDLDECLVLGIDTIVLTDVAKLYQYLDRTYSVAAVPEGGNKIKYFPDWSSKIAAKDLKYYFNIDVMYYNLEKIRIDKLIIKKSNEYFAKCLHPKYYEQDVLNYIFQDDVCYLDLRYNIFSWSPNALETVNKHENDCIIHYAGSDAKPWFIYHGEIDDYYWNYIFKTPWCNTPLEFAQCVRAAPDIAQSLAILKKNFFAQISGTKTQKLKYFCKFILSIFISALLSTRHS